MRKPRKLEIVPHPKAPWFGRSDSGLILKQLIEEIEGGDVDQSNGVLMEFIRQAGYISLWFFLKCICGVYGPFDKLTNHLHVDMCNVRQFWLFPGARGAMFLPRGHYKDLSVDTPVFTSNRGWIKHGDVKVGDYVFSPSGSPTEVIGVSDKFVNRRGFRITFSDGAVVKCGDTHLWRVVRHKRKRPYLGRRKDYNAQTGNYRYSVGSISYRESEIVEAWELSLGDDVGVLEGPLDVSETYLPIHPYLLGVWLGDGNKDAPRVTCSYEDIEIINRIRSLGYELIEHRTPSETTGTFAFGGGVRGKRGTGVYPLFRELDLHQNKHIPKIYKESSIVQRMELLRGLMDSDGSAGGGNSNTATFCNTSKQLSNDVYELVASLALRPRKRSYTISVSGKPYVFYQISFQHFKDRNPFYLQRKANLARPPSLHREYRGIKEIEEIVIPETSCIQVQGGTYVVGRNFVPTHNSTIVTEGGTAWELLRNPNLRIRISNATADRAANFMHTVKDIFEFDGFVRELYPDYCPKDKNQSYWNNRHIVMPNRTKRYREPSLESGGIGGSSEGHHYDLHVIDDMIGKKALNAMRQSNVVMEETKNWFWGADSLLVAPARSRTLVAGTRWGVDDAYSEIINSAKANLGYPIRDFIPNPNGEYVVYYRKAIEDGEIIFPENFTQEFFDRMANSGPDGWWEYVTQYLNDPYESSLTDLSGYDLKKCKLFYGDDDMWYVEFDGLKEPLCDFDVVQAGDPAATERYISARTSRSSQGIVAIHHSGKVFLISLHVGFVSPLEFFNWLFTDMEKFERFIRATYLETQGPFKIMGPLLREEEQKRRLYLKLWPSSAVGDKDGRIRSTLDPIMSRGDLYVAEPYFDEVRMEQKAFPQSSRKDILDMLTLGVSNSTRPFTPEEQQGFLDNDAWWANRTRNVAGY